jgi:hypothetical protein
MTWQLFELKQADGQPLQMMLDDRFRPELPGEELPTLTRIRAWCRKPAEGYYWHPEESADIEKVEDDVLARADEFGEGWVVYVMRRAVPGCLEYCFYSGGDSALERIVPALQAAHPERRFEVEIASDPGWAAYGRWFAEAMVGTPNPGFVPDRDGRLN